MINRFFMESLDLSASPCRKEPAKFGLRESISLFEGDAPRDPAAIAHDMLRKFNADELNAVGLQARAYGPADVMDRLDARAISDFVGYGYRPADLQGATTLLQGGFE